MPEPALVKLDLQNKEMSVNIKKRCGCREKVQDKMLREIFFWWRKRRMHFAGGEYGNHTTEYGPPVVKYGTVVEYARLPVIDGGRVR